MHAKASALILTDSINVLEIKVGYVSRGFQGLAVTVNSTKQQLGKSAIVSMIGRAVAGAECNTVIELKLEHHAA